VDTPIVAAAVIERIRYLIAIVHDNPERLRRRMGRQALGVPDPTCVQPPAAPVSCIDVDGRAHRIALRVREADVAGRPNRYVQLSTAVDGDVLQRMAVRSQTWRVI